MSDKIQMTEEQAREFMEENIYPYFNQIKINLKHNEQPELNYKNFENHIIGMAKINCYIKKSYLEIAAENFYENNEMDIVPEFCLDYVEKLEEEIERLKK